MKSNILIALLLLATIVSYQDSAIAATDSCRDLRAIGVDTGAADLPDGLDLELRRITADFDVAYLECQGLDAVEPTYGKLFEAAARQRLLRHDLKVYLVSHNDPLHAPDAETVLEPAVSLPPDARVTSPIMVQTIPAGGYLVLRHQGDYEKLSATFALFQDWARATGIDFDDRPVLQHFLTNPDQTPVEDWLTEIYFPVAWGE